MKSVQSAIESMERTLHEEAAGMASHRKHAVRLVQLLEARIGEARGDLLALEAQLDEAHELVAHCNAGRANFTPRSALDPKMQWGSRSFIAPVRHAD